MTTPDPKPSANPAAPREGEDTDEADTDVYQRPADGDEGENGAVKHDPFEDEKTNRVG